jgi:cytochrome d ubiquinol oxidase subunit I
VAFWSTLNSACSRRRWLLRWALWMLPRRGSPASWAGSSPSTAASPGPSTACCPPTSRLHPERGNLYGSLAGFVGFYTVLLVVEIYLMVKFARQGPGSLGTGRYAYDATLKELHHA